MNNREELEEYVKEELDKKEKEALKIGPFYYHHFVKWREEFAEEMVNRLEAYYAFGPD